MFNSLFPTPQGISGTLWQPCPATLASLDSNGAEVSQTLGRGVKMPRESSAQVSHIPLAPLDFYLAAGGTGLPGSSREEAKVTVGC